MQPQLDTKLTIVGIGGSLRSPSRTLKALECALQGAEEMGAEVELLSLRQLSLPFFERLPSYPSTVSMLLERTSSAQGLIFASPVYQGGMSGAVKNIFDFLELLEPVWLEGKVAGLISVAGGEGNVETISQMQNACRELRAWIVPKYCALAGTVFDEQHQIQSEKARNKLMQLGRNVAYYTKIFGGKTKNG